jgi:hypothetical protein
MKEWSLMDKKICKIACGIGGACIVGTTIITSIAITNTTIDEYSPQKPLDRGENYEY